MGFYEEIAERYDDMVGGPGRREAARELAEWLAESRGVRRALDVACGTGLHAIALARRRVEVVAADASAAMLARARAAAAEAGVGADIQWLHRPMETVSQAAPGPFDAILCLGNSLPHLLTGAQLDAAVRGFRDLLAPDGIVLVQILNYNRIFARRERIVGATRRGDTVYVRFYDFLDEAVRFNVLELTWRQGRCEHALHETELRPYRMRELRNAFTAAGFGPPALYGGLDRRPFDPARSDVLMLMAHRDD